VALATETKFLKSADIGAGLSYRIMHLYNISGPQAGTKVHQQRPAGQSHKLHNSDFLPDIKMAIILLPEVLQLTDHCNSMS